MGDNYTQMMHNSENFHDVYQKLNLSDDFLFSKVMQDEEILRLLLEKILNFSIRKVSIVQYQRVMEIDPEAHGIRLDVYANDEGGTRYSVEMQKKNEYNISKRSRYYLSIMDLDQLEKGEDYNKLRKTLVIFICLFDPFKMAKQKYTFERKCIEVDDLSLNDESSVVVLTNASDMNGDTDISKFFKYLINSTTETADDLDSEFVAKIHSRVLAVKNNKNVEVEFMKLRERDQENFKSGYTNGYERGMAMGFEDGKNAGFEAGKAAGFEDGKAAGFEDGKAAGFEDGKAAGFEDGKAAGFEDGALQEKLTIVKMMIDTNMLSDDDICKITGCNQELIDSMRCSES